MSKIDEEELVKFFENTPLAENLSFFTEADLELIKNYVPDVDMDTLLLSREPEPGEGTKVAIVKDNQGTVHRVPLRPN